MNIFLYDKTFEGLLTSVFEAYSRRIFPDALLLEGEPLPLFYDEIFTVITDEEKSGRVWRGLQKKLSSAALACLAQCWLKGESVIFDVDVKGGVNIKKFYGERALSIFVQPPSVEELRRRLVGRNTDAPEVIEQRLAKASYELTFAPQFDHVVVNDDLEKAQQEVYQLVKAFLDAE